LSSSSERVACHCNEATEVLCEYEKKDRGAEDTATTGTYPVQQVKLDTDGIPLGAVDCCLASAPDLLKGVEIPGASLSKRAEDSAQVVTDDDVHEKDAVDETGAVENVVVLRFKLIL
jgi:hypothetical protein